MSGLDADCPAEEVTSLLATTTAPQVSWPMRWPMPWPHCGGRPADRWV